MANDSSIPTAATATAQVSMITHNSRSNRGRLDDGEPLESSGVTAFQSHAAVLNNVGSILFLRDNAFDAMRVFRESVQTLIQATNNSECRLNKKRQDEMQDYLNYLLTSKDHLDRVSQLALASKSNHGINVAVLGSPELTSLSKYTCAKHIPGLFQSPSKFRVAKHSGHPCPFVLSFADPFSIKLKGKIESGHVEKQMRKKAPSDACEVSIDNVSEATLFNMGLIHAQWGSMESSLQYFQLAISVSAPQETVAPGLRNPIVLASLSNIGQIYCQSGRIEEALVALSDATARGRAAMILLEADQTRSGGPAPRANPRVASLSRVLARIMVNMGNAQFCFCAYDEAMHTCEDAFQLLRGQSTGMDAAAIWFNRALIHEHKQNRVQAIKNYNRFLKLACRIVGPEHPNIADALLRIGCVYYDMGQLQKALPPLLMALGIRAKFESVNHFSMSEIYHQIGKVLQAREEFDDALRALSKASEIQRKSSEKCHEGKFCEVCLELSETLLNLGRLHHGWGDFAESLTAYREVLAIFLRIFGKNHLQTARLHVIIANLELELGHVAQAMSNFEEAARIELEQGQTSLERTTVKVKNPLMRVTFSHHPCASSA